jgi:hypothetical protein
MKKIITALAGLATAGAAFAQVDPTQPMVVGVGNSNAKPGEVIVTHQTAPAASSSSTETTTLEKFVVTGSLLGHGRKATLPSRSSAPQASSTAGATAPAAAKAAQAPAAPGPSSPLP